MFRFKPIEEMRMRFEEAVRCGPRCSGPKPRLIPPPDEVAEVLATPAMVLTSTLSEEVRRIKKQLRLGNPNPITREEAIEVVAGTEWAKHWAEGMCRLTGITPEKPEWSSCVERLSRKAAERIL